MFNSQIYSSTKSRRLNTRKMHSYRPLRTEKEKKTNITVTGAANRTAIKVYVIKLETVTTVGMTN